jgi:hypothetical protein
MAAMRKQPSRRRWPRYSLRSFFALLTLFTVWLGWNANQVIERERLLESRDFLRTFEHPHRRQGESRPLVADAPRSSTVSARPAGRPGERTLPGIWRLLGAEPVDMDIWLRDDKYSKADARRIQSLFPECQVTLITAEAAQRDFLR